MSCFFENSSVPWFFLMSRFLPVIMICHNLLFAICYLLLAICYMLFAIGSLLFAVCCLIFAIRFLLFAICCLLFAVCLVVFAIWRNVRIFTILNLRSNFLDVPFFQIACFFQTFQVPANFLDVPCFLDIMIFLDFRRPQVFSNVPLFELHVFLELLGTPDFFGCPVFLKIMFSRISGYRQFFECPVFFSGCPHFGTLGLDCIWFHAALGPWAEIPIEFIWSSVPGFRFHMNPYGFGTLCIDSYETIWCW